LYSAEIEDLVYQSNQQPQVLMDERHWLSLASDREPDDPQSWQLLAQVDVQLGHNDAASKEVSRALRDDPWFPPALNLLGQLRLKAGDAVGARQLWQKSLEAEPGQPDVQRQLAGVAPSP
jgi:predicted Zn-dependent protease